MNFLVRNTASILFLSISDFILSLKSKSNFSKFLSSKQLLVLYDLDLFHLHFSSWILNLLFLSYFFSNSF